MRQWIDLELPPLLSTAAAEVLAQPQPSLSPPPAWRALFETSVVLLDPAREPRSLLASLGGELVRVGIDGAIEGRWSPPGHRAVLSPLGQLEDGTSLWARTVGGELEVLRFEEPVFSPLQCSSVDRPSPGELDRLAFDDLGQPLLVGAIDAGALAHVDDFVAVSTTYQVDLSTARYAFSSSKPLRVRPGPPFHAVSLRATHTELGRQSAIADGALLPLDTRAAVLSLAPSRAGLPVDGARLELPVVGEVDGRRLRSLSLLNGSKHPRAHSLLALAITRPTHLRVGWRAP